ncbi:MAG: hypothetical protein SFY32_06845 [Bacteroidota bacterium]|nr:hypothetical protein [Bacteroidota bacterium]
MDLVIPYDYKEVIKQIDYSKSDSNILDQLMKMLDNIIYNNFDFIDKLIEIKDKLDFEIIIESLIGCHDMIDLKACLIALKNKKFNSDLIFESKSFDFKDTFIISNSKILDTLLDKLDNAVQVYWKFVDSYESIKNNLNDSEKAVIEEFIDSADFITFKFAFENYYLNCLKLNNPIK